MERKSPRIPALLWAAAISGTLLGPANSSASEWELVWSDEFETDGALDPTKWDYETGGGGFGNNERQIYTNELENVRVENGNLIIQAHQTEGARVPGYTSARIITRERQSLKYGRIEVRAILPGETGTWPAIWMLSTDSLFSPVFWPDNGEIDIVETVGFERDANYLADIGKDFVENVHSTIHTNKNNFVSAGGGIGETIYDPDVTENFHTYALNWYPNRLEFYIDDTLINIINRETDVGIPNRNRPDDISPWWPFDQRFHLIMNIAVGGNWGGLYHTGLFPNSPYGTDGINHDGDWPQTMTVDYVRFYRQAGLPKPIVPTNISPEDYDREFGLIMENSDSETSSLNFTSIDSDDYVLYTILSPSEDIYEFHADLNSQATTLDMEIEVNGELQNYDIQGTAGDWSNVMIGSLPLKLGLNTIQIRFGRSSVKMGDLNISISPTGERNGFTEYGTALDTGDWLGFVNDAAAPFIFIPKGDTWAYAPNLLNAPINAESQFFYVYNLKGFDPFPSQWDNWYYSFALGKWLYAYEVLEDNTPADQQWIYLLQY